jgi:hypothetical protein
LEGPPPPHMADPAAYTLAQFDRLQLRHVTDAEAEHRQRYVAEQSRLVLGGLQTDAPQFARQAFAGAMVGFLNFGVGRDLDSVGMIVRGGHSLLRDQLDQVLSGSPECARPDAQTCGRYDLGAVTPLQYAVVLLSFVFLGVCSLRRVMAPTGQLVGFISLTLALVLINAVLCGVISGPYDRYQARVEWLIPLSALFVVLQWAERSAPARGRAAKPAASTA